MKTMNFFVAVAIAGSSLMAVSSCGKYDDGPKFSLLTKKMRLVGDWDAKEHIDSDGTSTSDNSDDIITFKKNGDYAYTSGNTSYNGTWEFTSDKEKIKTTYTSGNISISSESTILRLTNKELWVKDSNGDETKLEAK